MGFKFRLLIGAIKRYLEKQKLKDVSKIEVYEYLANNNKTYGYDKEQILEALTRYNELVKSSDKIEWVKKNMYISDEFIKLSSKEEIACKISIAYTYGGLNLTKVQVCEVLNIHNTMFEDIKREFVIQKMSDIIPRNILIGYNKEQVIERFSKEVLDRLASNRTVQEDTILRAQKKTLTKLILSKSAETIKFNDLVSALYDWHVFKPTEKHNKHIQLVDYTVNVILGDLHFGIISEEFSWEQQQKKMYEIADYVNEMYPNKKVNVLFLGDLIESFSGLNHLTTFLDMDASFLNASGIIKTANILIDILEHFDNLNKVIAVGGNHDRTFQNSAQNVDDGAAKLIFEFIKNHFKSIVTVSFHPVVNTVDSGNLRFILFHGDGRPDKLKGADQVRMYGDQDKFNIICIGHFHHMRIDKDQGKNFMKVFWSCICPPNDYTERNAYENAYPGWGIVMEHQGKPMVQMIPINYEV